MKYSLKLAFILPVLIQSVLPQGSPPQIYRDRHICPGEGCDYRGTATVKKASPAFGSIGSPKRSFTLKPGENVKVLDSEVHTRAGRFVVKRAFEKYKPGDVLWLYTYLGEGVFKIWHKGKWFEENLGFSPWGGSAGNRCQNGDEYCFGELEREHYMKWWVKIVRNNGRGGWVLITESNLDWPE